MKNKLIDLNNHLFAQLERLNDEELSEEQLEAEINRSKAVSNIAKNIVANAKVTLDAQIALGDNLIRNVPGMIASESDK